MRLSAALTVQIVSRAPDRFLTKSIQSAERIPSVVRFPATALVQLQPSPTNLVVEGPTLHEVAAAIAYVDAGHVRGKVVVTPA
jgi:hypothetical protein